MAHVDGPRSPAAEPGPARRCAASPLLPAREPMREPRDHCTGHSAAPLLAARGPRHTPGAELDA